MFIDNKIFSTLNLRNHKEMTNAKYALDLMLIISLKEGDLHPTTIFPGKTNKVGFLLDGNVPISNMLRAPCQYDGCAS
jgi:hypothetical protein